MNNYYYILLYCLIVIIILKNKHFLIERFNTFTRCKKKPLRGLTKQIFDLNNISQDNFNNDLLIPCGYNSIEKQLKLLNKYYKNVYAVKGCDSIVSKNKLWDSINKKYGRDTAKTIMPNTYILKNNEDVELFKKNYDKDSIYVLKKNLQRKKGILLENKLPNILYAYNNNYKLVQEFKESIIINKRKFNIRLYLLIICTGKSKKVYIHKLSKCLYTSKNVQSNKLDFDSNITNSYKVEKDFYKNNPLLLDDLYRYLKKKEYDIDYLKFKINEKLLLISNVILEKICLNRNENINYFQLFGVDLVIDNKLDPYILEFNKGPDMIPKDNNDKKIKYKVLVDIFDKLKIIKNKKKKNLFKCIYNKIE